jgi:hypothetical protein
LPLAEIDRLALAASRDITSKTLAPRLAKIGFIRVARVPGRSL